MHDVCGVNEGNGTAITDEGQWLVLHRGEIAGNKKEAR